MGPPRLEIRRNKIVTLGLLMLACALVCMAGFCTRLPQTSAAIFGWLGFCVFSFFVFALLRQLVRNDPILIIDEHGIEDRRSGFGLIEWRDIQGLSLQTAMTLRHHLPSPKCLCIAVTNPDKYLKRLWISGRLIAKASRVIGNADITIYFFGLAPSSRETWRFLMTHYHLAYFTRGRTRAE